MKRINNIWDNIIAFDNLYYAYLNARKGKQNRESVAAFSFNLEQELHALQFELTTGTYQPGEYRQFTIKERKPRLISAAPFRDRVVHHAVMNILEPILDKRFYYHSYACRKSKGVHKAVNQYQQWANQYAYVLKVDIARYFPSIRHSCLKQQLRAIIKDKPVLTLLDVIIDSSPTGDIVNTGLPIGNLTSQYFANLYLNNIDHWIKQVKKVPAYLRYVDDLFLMSNEKAQLWAVRDDLQQQLETIGLTLHKQKQTLHQTSERVDILGYKISKNKRWLRNDNGVRFQRKLKRYAKQYNQGNASWQEIQPNVQSWIGHALHGETYILREVIFSQYVFSKKID